MVHSKPQLPGARRDFFSQRAAFPKAAPPDIQSSPKSTPTGPTTHARHRQPRRPKSTATLLLAMNAREKHAPSLPLFPSKSSTHFQPRPLTLPRLRHKRRFDAWKKKVWETFDDGLRPSTGVWRGREQPWESKTLTYPTWSRGSTKLSPHLWSDEREAPRPPCSLFFFFFRSH